MWRFKFIWNALSWASHFNLKNGGNAIHQDISVKGKHHDIYKVLKLLIIWNEYGCMAKSISLHLRYMLSIQSSTSKCKDNKLFLNFFTLRNATCFTFFFFCKWHFFNLHFNLFSFSAWVLNHKKQNLCCELTSLDGKLTDGNLVFLQLFP